MPNEAGIKIYSIEKPTEPREIGWLKLPGKGVHRMWFTDGKYAHVGAMLPGIKERAYLIADISNPTNPKEAGRWWIPGTKEGEETPPDWTPFAGEHFHVHGAIPHGDRSYVALVDAGMAILDISDISKPKTISHIDWSPPFGGYAHTTLPLPGQKTRRRRRRVGEIRLQRGREAGLAHRYSRGEKSGDRQHLPRAARRFLQTRSALRPAQRA